MRCSREMRFHNLTISKDISIQFEWNMHTYCINFAPYKLVHKIYLHLSTNISMKLTKQKVNFDLIKCTMNKVQIMVITFHCKKENNSQLSIDKKANTKLVITPYKRATLYSINTSITATLNTKAHNI